MDYIDLHIHTSASDGNLTQEDVIKLGADKGLKAIAITDHDTAREITVVHNDIEAISGIELSAQYHQSEVHVLGYFIDPTSPDLIEVLDQVVRERELRNEKMIDKLKGDGYPISNEEMHKRHPDTIIGRPHIARLLVEKRSISSIREAFDKLIGEGKPYYMPRAYLTLKQAVDAIGKAGGVAVLAHPADYGLSDDELESLVMASKKAGMIGLEALHPGHTDDDVVKIKAFAERYDLICTGGSDFHGIVKPDIEIGCKHVPLQMLIDLKNAAVKQGTRG